MAYTPPAPLWRLVANLERQQLAQWRAEFHRGEDLETACQQHLKKIETTVTRYRGHNISVTVALVDHVTHNCAVGYFRLEPTLNGLYQVVSGTFTDA